MQIKDIIHYKWPFWDHFPILMHLFPLSEEQFFMKQFFYGVLIDLILCEIMHGKYLANLKGWLKIEQGSTIF